MSTFRHLDCVVIGYYEPPFEVYEKLIRQLGRDSEAYRDLRFSFVDVDGRKLNYIGLLNHVCAASRGRTASVNDEFRSGEIPNLAAVYLTEFLRKRGYTAEYINLFEYEKSELIQRLKDGPLCIAITTTFYVLNDPVIEIVQFIRAYNPHVKIIVGGPLISNHARTLLTAPALVSLSPTAAEAENLQAFRDQLEDIGADIYVIESQGEKTLTNIIDCLKFGGKLSSVPNLAYFDNGDFSMTKRAAENNSLDESAIDWSKALQQHSSATIQTRTARSCAFACSFCNYPARAGKLAMASLNSVRQELDSIRSLGYVKNVVFIDDTFNVPIGRFKEICKMMIERAYDFNWFSYFRCSNADEEAIELMAQSGCKGVFLGIESGSPEILEKMNKAASIEKYVLGIERLKQHDILTFASFISGFPGETGRTIRETEDFIRATRPHYYRSQLWYCEPGTPIERQRDKYQIKGSGFNWEHASMTSREAMDNIESMFRKIDESAWLPQWSFDFWIIPYLLGKGISLEGFREYMLAANRMLALEIESTPEPQKNIRQQEELSYLRRLTGDWKIESQPHGGGYSRSGPNRA